MSPLKALTLACFSGVLFSHAATPDWEWARIAGGGSVEYEGGLAIGVDGALFVSFGTSGGRLGTFSTTQAGKMWGRLDAQNNVQIAKNGPITFSTGNGNLKLAANGADDIFFSGSYYQNQTMGGFSAGTTDWGGVIGRMDTNCNVTWMKAIIANRENPCTARALATDALGNLIVATAFQRISFDGQELGATQGNGSGNEADVAVVKVRPDGTLIWMKKGGGPGKDEPWGVGCDQDGNVYVAGWYGGPSNGNAIFGTITLPVNYNGMNGFLVKYSVNGDVMWARSWGQTSPTVAYTARISDVKINNEGRIFVVGVLRVLQNDIPTSSGVGFLSEINMNGDDIWIKTFPTGVHPFSVATSWNGDIAVASSFYGSIQIDGATATSRGASDVLITCHDGTGRVRWTQSAGSPTVDYPLQIKYGIGSSLFLIGITTGNATFGSHLIDGIGNTDIFIAKLSPEASLLPRITSQPRSAVVSGGMNIELNAAAVGDLPLTYQWWFNGSPLSGQTSPSLLLTNVRSENAGSYFVVAKNSAGETQSEIANVSYTDAGSLQLSVHPSLTIFGTPGRTYRIDYSVETRSPAVWTTITNLSLPTTPFVWQDTKAAITDKRFYRVLLQP